MDYHFEMLAPDVPRPNEPLMFYNRLGGLSASGISCKPQPARACVETSEPAGIRSLWQPPPFGVPKRVSPAPATSSGPAAPEPANARAGCSSLPKAACQLGVHEDVKMPGAAQTVRN